MISKKATVIYGVLFGALFGGLGPGVLVLVFFWYLLSWSLSEAIVPCALSVMVGAPIGAIVGLVAGGVSRTVTANKRDVINSIIWSSCSVGMAVVGGMMMSPWISPTWAMGLAIVIGETVIFTRKGQTVFEQVFTRKTVPVLIISYRTIFGLFIGFILGHLIAWLVLLIVNFILSEVTTAMVDLAVIVPLTGLFAGAGASIYNTITGASTRDTIYFAIEASATAGMATVVGAALTWVWSPILGIGVTTGAITLWSMTRGKRIGLS